MLLFTERRVWYQKSLECLNIYNTELEYIYTDWLSAEIKLIQKGSKLYKTLSNTKKFKNYFLPNKTNSATV